MKETYGEILERLGWSYTDDGDGNIELEKYSPAGEDFIITVGAENFVENVKEYAAHFDQDEHIEMWISARRSGTSQSVSGSSTKGNAPRSSSSE